MISMQGLIERAARLNPHGVGSRFMNREQSWAQLADRVARLAAALRKAGVAEGDRVAVLSLNSDRYYETIFATCWAGACTVPLNTRWALPENQYAISDCTPKILFFDASFSNQAEQLLKESPSLESAIFMDDEPCPTWAQAYEALIEHHCALAASTRGADAMAGIFYTGGTTGFPKGVMQSHQALWSSAIGATEDFGFRRESIYLHAAPMFHIADFAGSMGATLQCATHHILPAFSPDVVLQTIAAEQISHTLLVPSMIKMMLDHPSAPGTDVAALQKILYGASPMPAATLQRCMDLWPNVELVQAYGQTELAPIATTLSASDHRKGGDRLRSAGRPTAVTDLRIVDNHGKDCPQRVTGEVAVRGPHTMLGYWNKPEQTQQTLKNGWVFTGDAGFIDADGYLFIVDRVKDMIISGGENVYTSEVENALMTHEAVQDAAVFAIPDDEWGEAVHAVVIKKPGSNVTETELITHCRQHIAGYKLPKRIEFRQDPLPLSGAGKVLKTELRKPFWENHQRNVN